MAGFIAPIIAGVASGAASSLFSGKGKKPSPIDVSELRKTILSGSKRQREITGELTPGLTAKTEEFTKGIRGSFGELGTERELLKQRFLKEVGQEQGVIGSKLFDTLRSRILRGVPEQEQRLRETLAGTGGLQRGTAVEQLAAPTLQAGEQIGRAAEDIALGQLQEKAQVREKLFNLDNDFLQQKFGVDKELLATALASGREDLIREAQSLIDIADQETADLLSIEQLSQTGRLASESAGASRESARIGAGSELLATILPLLLQGKGGGGQVTGAPVR